MIMPADIYAVADRELFPIAPKGRPVKQCEHCRSARKDKSHHAKCNCGNKKHKDTSESGPKSEHPALSGLNLRANYV